MERCAYTGTSAPSAVKDVDLARRVVDVIIATNDVGDFHVPVIDTDTEVVGRRTVGAGDDEVIEFVVGNFDAALDGVFPHDTPTHGIA